MVFEGGDERAEWLGHHAWRGEVWDKAVGHLRSAGVKAAARAAGVEARIYFEQALAALGHLPSTPTAAALGIDLRCELEGALMFLGAFETSLERLREAEALARTAGDRNRLGWVLGRITYNLASLGDLDGALDAGERAATAFTGEAEPHHRVSVNTMKARARYGLGDYRQAIELCRQSESLIEAHGPLPPGWALVYSRIFRVLCLAELGQFTEAEAWGAKALHEAETTCGPPEQMWAYVGVGRLHVLRGTFEAAIALLEPAMRMLEGGVLAVYLPRIASTLGTAYVHTGRVAEGLAFLEQAEATGASIQFRYGQPLVLTQRGDACLLAGDQAQAAECVTRALAMARESRARGSEAYARHVLGKLAALGHSPNITAARMDLHESLSLAEELGMRPLAAHCHLGLGKLFRRTGDPTKADQHLATATAMYLQMDMGVWLEKAHAEVTGVDR